VYDRIDFGRDVTDPLNDQARLVELDVLRCPSDFDNPQPQAGGAINYYGNKGSDILWQSTTMDGLFFRSSRVRFRDITDGTSNTAALSERLVTDGNNGTVNEESDVFLGTTNPADQDEAVSMCRAVDINNLAFQFPVFMGAPWMNGQHCYLHVDVPNARSCGFYPTKATMPCSSRHPGGAQTAMADGVVRFVTENVDVHVWRAVGTRAGNEVVGKF
jgi:prepilin-type processing-associated H-X9-DG protein